MANATDEKSREDLIAELGKLYAERALYWPAHGSGIPPAPGQLEALGAERTMRVEAERLRRIKDEFLANLSHEIRTPLNAILGWSQLLKPGKTSEADLIEGLEIITRNARTQARLIDDLLDMSRIISGKMRLDVQRVDLPAVIDAASESVKPAAGSN